jgi:hypothetical protein
LEELLKKKEEREGGREGDRQIGREGRKEEELERSKEKTFFDCSVSAPLLDSSLPTIEYSLGGAIN